MNKNELISRCLIGDGIKTNPFKEKQYEDIIVLRHESNKKWYGLIFTLDKVLYINLKAKPEIISILKDQYPDIITSAWHMNKLHWCKIDVKKINSDELDKIIKISYDITAPKRLNKKNK